ncbi:MAG: TraB/GumN family protein [Bacteroidales bacterium]|nr:TraB/GumN family protein [Bacteroidales bacterium]
MYKRIIPVLTALLVSVFATFGQSMLWKVSGKKMKAPSYLYGTIHIQDARVASFDTTVLNALNRCEAFAMEVLLDEINMRGIQKAMMMPEGKYLNTLLSTEDFALLDSICKAKLGISAIFMNGMKPFFVSSTLEQLDLRQDAEDALDLFLLKKAREYGKVCYGLEEYMDQIRAIDAISLKEQADMLSQMLHDTAQVSQDFEDMLEAYLRFELDSLAAMTQDTSLPKKFEKVLVNDRNVTMVKRFLTISGEHTVFCAVGAAHLAGKKGIIALLRKKGYTVEPVPFTWKSEE